MAWMQTIPLSGRLAAVAVLGLLLGAFANWAISAWSWRKPRVSPWQMEPEGVKSRNWADRLPVIGWLRLRRDAAVVGRLFWLRPLVIEIVLAAGLAALYWWEVERLGLWFMQEPLPSLDRSHLVGMLHCQFLSHAILIGLMVIASFIDIDETYIPDQVTVTGTLLGLALSAIIPLTLLPNVEERPFAPAYGLQLMQPTGRAVNGRDGLPVWLEPTHTAAPHDWPLAWGGRPQFASLATGLGCYALWCLSLTTRIWRARHGVGRNLRVISSRVRRELISSPLRWIALGGAAGILAVWTFGGGYWVGLLSSLIGLAVSGGIVWAVRLIGASTLKREAMGFGDVTLMMMIGAFLGWQAGLVIFFLAPLAAVLIGIGQAIVKRDQMIPYGPFLCLAALVVIIRWTDIWQVMEPYFAFGKLIPGAALVCLPAMWIMLFVWQAVKTVLWGSQDEG